MGKAHGTKRRRKKQFNYTIDRKKLQKKSMRMPHIRCATLKNAWTEKQGIAKNFKNMGLSSDVNRTFKIPSAQKILEHSFVDKKSKKGSPAAPAGAAKPTRTAAIPNVIEELEEQANKPTNSTFHVSNEIALFAQNMTRKYGDDYKRMAKDVRNYYQLTPKQIKRKIEDYHSSQLVTAMKMANKEEKSHK